MSQTIKTLNEYLVKDNVRGMVNTDRLRRIFVRVFGRYLMRYYDEAKDYAITFSTQSKASYCDNRRKEIVIAEATIVEMLKYNVPIMAIAYHEMAHTLYTNNATRENIIQVVYEMSRGVFDNYDFDSQKAHSIWNVLEDEYIERKLAKDYPFLASIINPLRTIVKDDGLLMRWRSGSTNNVPQELVDLAEEFASKRLNNKRSGEIIFTIMDKWYKQGTRASLTIKEDKYEKHESEDDEQDDDEQEEQSAYDEDEQDDDEQDEQEEQSAYNEDEQDDDEQDDDEQEEQSAYDEDEQGDDEQEEQSAYDEDEQGDDEQEEQIAHVDAEDEEKNLPGKEPMEEEATKRKEPTVEEIIEDLKYHKGDKVIKKILKDDVEQEEERLKEERQRKVLDYAYSLTKKPKVEPGAEKLKTFYNAKQFLYKGMTQAQAKGYSSNPSHRISIPKVLEATLAKKEPKVFYGRGKDTSFMRKVVLFEDVSGSAYVLFPLFSTLAKTLVNAFEQSEWWAYGEKLFKRPKDQYDYLTYHTLDGTGMTRATYTSALFAHMRKHRHEDNVYVVITDGDMDDFIQAKGGEEDFTKKMVVIGAFRGDDGNGRNDAKDIKENFPYSYNMLDDVLKFLGADRENWRGFKKMLGAYDNMDYQNMVIKGVQTVIRLINERVR